MMLRVGKRLIWVKKRPGAASELRPFIPQQRTCGERGDMSIWCQEWTLVSAYLGPAETKMRRVKRRHMLRVKARQRAAAPMPL
jgi:hypothetical protein